MAMAGAFYLGEDQSEDVRCEDIIGRKLALIDGQSSWPGWSRPSASLATVRHNT